MSTFRWAFPALVFLAAACTGANDAADESEDSGVVGGTAGGSAGGDPGGGGTGPSGGDAPVAGAPVGGEGPVGGAPVGGAPDGGAPVGGTPVGGAPVGGGEPSDACATACGRIAGCVVEVCPAEAAASAAEVESACLFECGANPSFPIVVEGIGTCGDLVAYGRQAVGEPLPTICPEGGGPTEHFPVCDVFAERIITCLGEACPATGSATGVLVPAYTRFCDDAANRGEFDPVQLGQFITPQTPCDFAVIADIVTSSIEPGGDLAAFCTNGPINAPALCTAACDRIGPCVPPDGDLGFIADPLFCQYICVVSEGIDERVWACGSELEEGGACEEAVACFQAAGPAPELTECEVYAARAIECTIEACAPIENVAQGYGSGIVTYCNETIFENPESQPAFAAVGMDTPCDDPSIGPLVTSLVVDTEENPMDGTLAPFCAEGPLNDLETVCAPACEVLVPCLPAEGDGSELRAPGVCVYYCALSPEQVPDEAWTCIAEAVSCEAAFACVQ
jgi:hypothetical protein